MYNLVEKYYDEYKFINLHLLKGYKHKLPKIKYGWNISLLHSILLQTDYRDVININGGVLPNKMIMVKDASQFTSIDTLCLFLIKEKFEGNMHETVIYDFLTEQGILSQKYSDTEKKLPQFIKKSPFFTIDEFGSITLKEEYELK